MPYSGNPTVARFKTDMFDLTKNIADSFEQKMLNEADELIGNMRGAVPVLTGRLRASIRKKNVSQKTGGGAFQRVSILVLAGGPSTTVHSPAGAYDYSLGVEFGTVKEKAEPFFYSSARLYAQQGAERAQETLDEAIAENNKVRELRAENYTNGQFTVSTGGRGGATVL